MEAVPESVNIFESKNVAFNGSLCVDGEGVGVVIRTGVNTVGVGWVRLIISKTRGLKKRVLGDMPWILESVGTCYIVSLGTAQIVVPRAKERSKNAKARKGYPLL